MEQKIIFVVATIVAMFVCFVTFNRHNETTIIFPIAYEQVTPPNFCKSIADITEGKWVLNPALTSQDFLKRKSIDANIRVEMGWPASVFRPDYKCSRKFPIPGFRLQGECDRYSDKPCCSIEMGECGNTSAHCNCGKLCTDFRKYGASELYNWTPKSGCQVRYFKSDEICRTMNNNRMQLFFTGDSFIRQLHTMFILMITGDFERGSLRRNSPPDQLKHCRGDMQLSTKRCSAGVAIKKLTDLYNLSGLCSGQHNFDIDIIPDYGTSFNAEVNAKWDFLMNKPNTWIITGIGLAYYTNYERAERDYYSKVWKKMQQSKNGWPKFIWINMHHLKQFMRTEDQPHQYASAVLGYNEKATAYWTKRNVPVIHTYNFSEFINTYDGVHYAFGYNQLKMNVVFNEIQKYYDAYQYQGTTQKFV